MVQFNHPKGSEPLGPTAKCIELTGGEQKYPDATSWELLLEFLVINEVASDEMVEEYANSHLTEKRIALGVPRLEALRQLEKRGLATDEMLGVLRSEE